MENVTLRVESSRSKVYFKGINELRTLQNKSHVIADVNLMVGKITQIKMEQWQVLVRV